MTSSLKQQMVESLSAEERQVQLLQAFVRAKSPNPPGDTAEAAAVLVQFLQDQGIPVETIDPQPGGGRPNVVSEFQGGKGPGPRILMNGHIDVFPVDAADSRWERDPWSGDLVHGRVHGRGVVDMKSGTASLAIAYAELYHRRQHLRGSVIFCAVSDEETGGKWGTKYLVQQDRRRFGGDVVLNTEPASLETVRFTEKGTLRLTCRVVTKGALGAYLNLSKGAVRTSTYFLTDVIKAVESMPTPETPAELVDLMAKPDVREMVDKAMGPGTSDIVLRPTVNVGTIKGGLKINMIPETCVSEVDIRLPAGLLEEKVLEVIRSIIPNYPEATIELSIHRAASNPFSFSSISHPIPTLLAENAKTLAPDRPKPLPTPSVGATDCKHYRYAGIPAFTYGCSPMTMGAVNESASVEEFLHVTKVHACAAWDYLTAAPEGEPAQQ